jgi:CHAD domain-containing protein
MDDDQQVSHSETIARDHEPRKWRRFSRVPLPKLPARLLDRPAPEGARRIAVLRLRALESARPRLDDAADAEALHDFRVALRRLRSVLRAYRSVLGDTVSPKTRRLLTELARATGACRDGEVRLEWIAAHRGAIDGSVDAAFVWVEGRLRRAKADDDRKLRRELENFGKLTARIERALTHYHVSLAPPARRPVQRTRDLLSAAVIELIAELRERLAIPQGSGDVRELHQARIAAKKLRYVLEPVAEGGFAPVRFVRASRAALAQLRFLQDELGRVNDSHEFVAWLRERIAKRSSAPENSEKPIAGLLRQLAGDAEEGYSAATLPENRRRLEESLAGVESAVRAMVTRPAARTTFRA